MPHDGISRSSDGTMAKAMGPTATNGNRFGLKKSPKDSQVQSSTGPQSARGASQGAVTVYDTIPTRDSSHNYSPHESLGPGACNPGKAGRIMFAST
jgi:hypothetical protein